MFENIAILVAGVTLFYLLVEIVIRRPQVGFALLGIIAILNWHVPNWRPVASVLGVSASLPDFIAAVLAMAAALSVLTHGRKRIDRNLRIFADGFIVLLSVSLVSGMINVGLAAALNEFRPWFYILSVTIWTLTVLSRCDAAESWFKRWIVITACGITVVGILNVSINGFGGASTSVVSAAGTVLEAGRPITSGQAMLVGLAAVICLWMWSETQRNLYYSLALVFIMVVLFAQHRSVWFALAVALIASIFFLRSCQLPAFAFTSAAVVLLALASFSLFGDTKFAVTLLQSADDSRTYEGRVFDWVILIRDSVESGIHTVLMGFPLGTGWWRFREDGLRIGYIPHNWYVATYLRTGIVGITFMFGFLLLITVRGMRCRTTLPILAMIAMLVTYCWAYNMVWYLAPALSWIVWAVRPNRMYEGSVNESSTAHAGSAMTFGSSDALVPNRTDAT